MISDDSIQNHRDLVAGSKCHEGRSVNQRPDMNTDGTAEAIGADNFFKVLGLIDRTIIPRRLVLSNGAADLALLVARQRAVLDGAHSDGRSNSLEITAAAIARFCAAERHVEHQLEPIPRAPAGYSAIAIVNAQDGTRLGENADGARHYRFAKDGWPLAAPSDANLTSLATAMQLAQAMRGWRGSVVEQLKTPTLLVAISEELVEDVSISAGDSLTVATTPPAQLGRIISRWRNRSNDDDGTYG
jgi:hypothetical protein